MFVVPRKYRRHLIRAAATVFLTATAAPTPAAAAEPPPAPSTRPAGAAAATVNPEYMQWAALKQGAWERVRVLSNTRNVESTTTLKKVTADEVVLEVAEAGPGEKPGEARERVVKAETAKPGDGKPTDAKPDEVGDEKVAVANVTLACHFETHGARKPDVPPTTAGDTTWTCAGVPGFVKRVSWLPADPDLGLKEVHGTEMLVAFDLPPRVEPAAGAEGRPPVHAEPPSKFSWTYQFDPPGWRHWARQDDGTWEENWQTGESTHAKVVGWIADGDIVGTLVRRTDGTTESVIPDAGKGATFYFRNGPDDKWLVLGDLEESE